MQTYMYMHLYSLLKLNTPSEGRTHTCVLPANVTMLYNYSNTCIQQLVNLNVNLVGLCYHPNPN